MVVVEDRREIMRIYEWWLMNNCQQIRCQITYSRFKNAGKSYKKLSLDIDTAFYKLCMRHLDAMFWSLGSKHVCYKIGKQLYLFIKWNETSMFKLWPFCLGFFLNPCLIRRRSYSPCMDYRRVRCAREVWQLILSKIMQILWQFFLILYPF